MPELQDLTEVFQCDCTSLDHIMVVDFLSDEGYEELTFHLQLNQFNPWYTRIWYALKYIFNQNNNKCHWSDIVIKKEDLPRLKTIIERYNGNI